MDATSSSEKRRRVRLFFKDLFYGFVTEYETPKIVMIHSYTIAILLRIIQMFLLTYSVIYLFIYEKGYQKSDTSIISSITLKVKGIGYVETSRNETYIFDGSDYIIPPSENNAIFIMTNFLRTEQSRSECAESISVSEAICRVDDQCQGRSRLQNAHGRWTGRCLLSPNVSDFNGTQKPAGLCEMQGWCPVEDDLRDPTVIKEILNFTIFIKNFIEFPTFNVKHKNLVDNLKSCVFDPVDNIDCPIFRLDHILNQAEKNVTERRLILRYGAVIRIKLDWDCNLDRHIKKCRPRYSFARLDTPFHEEHFSVGFNFRFASHWKKDEVYVRSLTKAYGIRLVMSVSGKAGKFDLITLSLNTGSLVGIFGLATFVCDLILLNLTKKAALYRDHVFQRVQIDKTKTQSDPTDLAFENASATTYPSSKSLNRLLDTTERTHSSSFISSNQFLILQPSLGLTNSMK